jgi:hypothetical protein
MKLELSETLDCYRLTAQRGVQFKKRKKISEREKEWEYETCENKW